MLAELEGRVRLDAMGPISSALVDVEVPGRRLLQEGAGAGAARLVHRVVDGDEVAQVDVLRVLPADLEDGVDGRVEQVVPAVWAMISL